MENIDKTSPSPNIKTSPPAPQRRFFMVAILIALFSGFLGIGSLISSFLRPVKKNTYGGMVDAGPLVDLQQKKEEPILFAHGRFWLIQSERGLLALHSSCTHLDCKFGWDNSKNLFVCPCHGSQFKLDGTVLNGPAARSLDQFPLLLIDSEGEVFRQTDQTGGYLQVDDTHYPPAENEESSQAHQRFNVVVDTGKKIIGQAT